MHSRITTTAFRSSKRNDSSAFSAAFLNMGREPAESEYTKLKSEVLKTAGTSIAESTPCKTPYTAKTPSVENVDLNSDIKEEKVVIKEDYTSPKPTTLVENTKPNISLKEKSNATPVLKNTKETKKVPPKPPIKKEIKRASSKVPQKKPELDNLPPKPKENPQRNTQTEIETLRSRISALNAKVRKLEAENAKLKETVVPEIDKKDSEKARVVDLSDNRDDSRRVTFLKDKLSYLQNQVDLLKKGLTFHRPIVYNAERFINEAIGLIDVYFESSKGGEMEELRKVQSRLNLLRTKLGQLQKTFSEKWKEHGQYIDKSIGDYEEELAKRAKKLGEIEEGLYQFAIMLNPVITNKKELPDTELVISLQDKSRCLMEAILTEGIEYAGNKGRSIHREHLLAKQLYLQEFNYKKEDAGIKESFQFMDEKFCETLIGCCYEKKKPQMESIIRHLKQIEQIFTTNIQLREKQLYLYKAYTESFKGTHTKAYSMFSSKTREVYDSVLKYLHEPFQDIVSACENAKENGNPTSYIALCGVIDHVSQAMNKGFSKVLSALKAERAMREEVCKPTDRFTKFTKKTKEGLEANAKAIAETKSYFAFN